MTTRRDPLEFHKALDPDGLPDGRVVAVTVAHTTVCMSHHDGAYAALDNRCPHQGGPLGEGSIENGWLRCPWHGWDYDPLTGRSPGGFDDGVRTHPVQVREDGVYVGLSAERTHTTTMTDVFAESLARWGVRWCFGMVGHSNLGLADAIRRQEEAGRMRYVGIRHEGAAAFAASAYGKLTGRPAAALAIAGPGATNLLTGLWDAHVDRAPVLALTGQVGTQWLGRENFQEIDLRGAFGGVAAFSATLLHGSDPGEIAARAVRSAVLDSGVAHVVFPDEVQVLPAPEGAQATGPAGRLPDQLTRPSQASLERALQRLLAARRPVFVLGHGARRHRHQVIALAEALGCPVVTTFKAKGLIADAHPLGCGVLGRSGTPIASWFVNEADLLVVWGASFSTHTGITPKIPTIQVDRDPRALGNRHAVDVLLQGDIGEAARLLQASMDHAASVDHREEIAARWATWRAEKQRRHAEGRGRGVHSIAVFEALTQVAPEDAILCVDVGNNTYSFGRYFEPTAQAVLMSGYLGSIGFALPAALGAWAATQEEGSEWSGRKVISISGDGGLGQYLAELTTLSRYDMDVTHIVLNNDELGKISKEQRAGRWEVWQTALVNPSFAAVAEQCGLLAVRVDDASDLVAALELAIAHPGPALVEVVTDVDLI